MQKIAHHTQRKQANHAWGERCGDGLGRALWSYSQSRGAIFLVEEAVHSTLVGSARLRLAYRTPPRDGVRDACVFARKLSVCSKVLGLPVMPLLAPRHETEVKEDGRDQCAVGCDAELLRMPCYL